MKEKNGYTMIEILAIIVILAIIAVITTPVVVNILNNSRKKAYEETCDAVERAARQYVLTELDGKVTNNMQIDTKLLKPYLEDSKLVQWDYTVKATVAADGTVTYYYNGRSVSYKNVFR